MVMALWGMEMGMERGAMIDRFEVHLETHVDFVLLASYLLRYPDSCILD